MRTFFHTLLPAGMTVLAIATTVGGQCHVDQIIPNNAPDYAAFGRSIAIDDDVLIVGADEFSIDSPGSAYVFRHVDGNWIQEATLLPSKPTKGSRFGLSVDIYEDVCVVGDRPGDGADVFRYDDSLGIWQCEARLEPPPQVKQFGRRVSIYGDRISVGATQFVSSPSTSGAVYIYRFDETAADWIVEETIQPPDPASDGSFGAGHFIHDNLLVVGVSGDSDFGFSSGAMYIFEFDEETDSWSSGEKLFPSDIHPDQRFGSNVLVDHDRIFVSTDEDLVIGPQDYHRCGTVYVFERDEQSGQWVESHKLIPPDPTSSMGFGESLAADGSTLVIGAPDDDETDGRTGAVYVYQWNGDTWQLQSKFRGPNLSTSSSEEFGKSVAMANSHIFVSRTHGSLQGEVFVHEYPQPMADCGTPAIEQCALDCNENGIPDQCDIEDQIGFDCNANLIPDECEVGCSYQSITDVCGDCNGNRISDAEEIARGSSLDCNENGVPDNCELLDGGYSYIADTGGDFGGIRDEFGEMIWLSEFMVQTDGEWINTFEILIPDHGLHEEQFRVALWSDPTQDGLPHDAQLLTVSTSQVFYFPCDSDTIRVPIESTHVGEPGDVFFAGVQMVYPIGEYPAAFEGRTPSPMNSWFISGTNIYDLSDNRAIGLMDSYDFEGSWVIRVFASGDADANKNGTLDDCEAMGDLDGNGRVDLFDLLTLLASWGDCDSPCPPNCPADQLVPDCSVNSHDLEALLQAWDL